nr:PilZ domain-containing protein [Nitrospira sp. KM1]
MVSRKCPRFAVQLEVRFGKEHTETSGTILNLSQDGCMIMTDQPAEPAQYLQLDMYLVDGHAPVRVSLAAVRWSSATRFGLEYIKVGSEEQERLKLFMVTLGENPIR